MAYSDSGSEKSPRSPDALLPDTRPANSPPRKAWLNTRLKRLCAALGILSLTLLATSYLALALRNSEHVLDHALLQDFTDNSKLLNSPNATSRFRDNLRFSAKDKFITAWPSSGWTNDVMAAANLVYMARLTGRTPIIPPFTPSHVGNIRDVGTLRFGDIFDVPRLANELGMHVLEWDEVKNPITEANGRSEVEKLGCWSAWSLGNNGERPPRESDIPAWYNLDISYTPVPKTFTLSGGIKKDQYYASLWSLASLAFPQSRDWAWQSERSRTFPVATGSGEKLQPDDQMLCYDLLYFIGLAREEEWYADYSPYWREVATHMHWAPKLLDLAENYLRRHFKLAPGEPIPPFISVHVRRADFAGWCPPNVNAEACFAPSSAYARRVGDVQAALRARDVPVDARAVLVTSDERSAEWWEEIAEFGPEWGWVDHTAEQTVEKYGRWYPVILDAVFQSMGAGFVGTEKSTMSLLSQRRVEDWQGGVGQEVRWGTPNADDH